MKRLLMVAGLIGAAVILTSPAQANDWGCEVLLCAASSNPSWQGVQACHPPMHRLISEMSRPGFSWPTCPGAGTGAPGFERYEECPSGWHPTFDQTRESGGGSLSLCARTVNTCGGRFSHRADCETTETQPRPVRSDPYFFDIRNQDGSGVIRHWFNLRR